MLTLLPISGSLAERTSEPRLFQCRPRPRFHPDNAPGLAFLKFSCFCTISLVLHVDQSWAGKRDSGLYGCTSFQESLLPNIMSVGVRGDSKRFAKSLLTTLDFKGFRWK